jgi:hypothetical protein
VAVADTAASQIVLSAKMLIRQKSGQARLPDPELIEVEPKDLVESHSVGENRSTEGYLR